MLCCRAVTCSRNESTTAISFLFRRSIDARIQRRPGSEREVRANYANTLSSSKAYKPQKETGPHFNPSQKATSGQELERFDSFRPRPCLRHVWRITLTRKLAVS